MTPSAPEPRCLLRVVVPGTPVGKGRPRVGRRGRTHWAQVHQDPKSQSWEGAASVIARAAYGARAAMADAVEVRVAAVARRPDRLNRRKDPDHRLWRTSKPDIDNVVKSALDALVLAGVLVDDTLVARLRAESLFTARGEGPAVEIEVWQLEGEALPS